MYCKYCGNQIEEDSKFCKCCGKMLMNQKIKRNFSWGRMIPILIIIGTIIMSCLYFYDKESISDEGILFLDLILLVDLFCVLYLAALTNYVSPQKLERIKDQYIGNPNEYNRIKGYTDVARLAIYCLIVLIAFFQFLINVLYVAPFIESFSPILCCMVTIPLIILSILIGYLLYRTWKNDERNT